jgi:hypothetical protein
LYVDQADYWKFVATGFFIGSIGMFLACPEMAAHVPAGIAMVFISANNSLLMAVPTEYSG